MTTMTFDRLAYVDRLTAAGFNEPQARAMADGLDQALREEVATKSDIALLKGDTTSVRGDVLAVKNDIALLKSDIASVRGDMSAVKSDIVFLKGDIASVKGDLLVVKSELLAAMKADKIDLLKWVIMLIVGQTAVFTALKLVGR